ncbi:hypothetical protein [Streptomyces sp. Caat 7-52]|uniref:hypothetical protein n=1 Tax=Streptomyces sp. Caat 7-52 TaxID=2949637 RepID=UPI0020352FCF|nr:hypothetical protein [Streptomyces sp. Caat 7-52]
MGERHCGEGPPGCRCAHPGGTVAAPEPADPSGGFAGLETLFGAALRAEDVDPDAEHRAVAAFRAARAAGAHGARSRARDDWRPGRPRRGRRSLRTTLSLALASLTVGGVAVAAIGTAGSGTDGDRPAARRSAVPPASAAPAPGRPAAGTATDGPTADPSDTGPAGHPAHPATARDTLAHCRTFVRAGERGGALEATAWQRLVTAAGGREKVAAYCAAQVAQAQAHNADKADDPGNTGKGENKGGSPGKPGGGKAAGGKR